MFFREAFRVSAISRLISYHIISYHITSYHIPPHSEERSIVRRNRRAKKTSQDAADTGDSTLSTTVVDPQSVVEFPNDYVKDKPEKDKLEKEKQKEKEKENSEKEKTTILVPPEEKGSPIRVSAFVVVVVPFASAFVVVVSRLSLRRSGSNHSFTRSRSNTNNQGTGTTKKVSKSPRGEEREFWPELSPVHSVYTPSEEVLALASQASPLRAILHSFSFTGSPSPSSRQKGYDALKVVDLLLGVPSPFFLLNLLNFPLRLLLLSFALIFNGMCPC
eukprot:g81495.t1